MALLQECIVFQKNIGITFYMTFTQRYGKDWRLKSEGIRLKYGNQRKVYNNRSYHSILEANYAQQLDLLKKSKHIKDWIPQYRMRLFVNEKHIVDYIADFLVTNIDGTQEIHETKGMTTTDFLIKWRLAQALHDTQYKFVLIK